MVCPKTLIRSARKCLAIRAGLVKRIASQQDGRRSELQPTGQGRRALGTVRRFRMKFFARLTAEYGPIATARTLHAC